VGVKFEEAEPVYDMYFAVFSLCNRLPVHISHDQQPLNLTAVVAWIQMFLIGVHLCCRQTQLFKPRISQVILEGLTHTRSSMTRDDAQLAQTFGVVGNTPKSRFPAAPHTLVSGVAGLTRCAVTAPFLSTEDSQPWFNLLCTHLRSTGSNPVGRITFSLVHT
jgi:hypothetical protein